MYSLAEFGRMIDDDVRTHAFAAALEREVQEGDVVLDIGTGTGIFALIACRLGASKVYAIEPDEVIHVARDIARDNGFDDRIVFIQEMSTEVNLPEKVDVVVSDIRGILPLCGTNLVAIADARTRFMKDDGTLIPQRDTMMGVPVDSEDLYRLYDRPWAENDFGFDFGAGRRLVVNTWQDGRATQHDYLATPFNMITIDYRIVEHPDVRTSNRCTIQRDGVVHGFNLWFETELVPGIGFSTAPHEPRRVYDSAFFPLEEAVEVQEGDRITFAFNADLVGTEYDVSWNTRITDATGRMITASFEQASTLGVPRASDVGR